MVYQVENLGLVMDVGVGGADAVVASKGVSIGLVEELVDLVLGGACIARPQFRHEVVVLAVVATAVEHRLTHLLFIVHWR